MILYVPSSAAIELSSALWDLSRPPSVRQPNDTSMMFGWVDDLQAQRWIVVDTEYTIPVHPDAELGGIASVLQRWIDSGHLPADTLEVLGALIESVRGQSLVVYDAFPAYFKGLALNYEQMVTLGHLPSPSLPAPRKR